MKTNISPTEAARLEETYSANKPWLKWGPYLSERQWGTVREDYSPHGTAWDYFPHDHARSRAYRWGEDGLAGISDDRQRICFALSLWNGKDPILKERLFGLAGPEGNHGEDVKELYYYLDNTPTHSYMRHLYKYPQAAFPYGELVERNTTRSKDKPEFELTDSGVFAEQRYFDVFTEYGKASEEDILIRVTVYNRGPVAAPVSVLPTLWFRNLWDVGELKTKPVMRLVNHQSHEAYIQLFHEELGEYHFYAAMADRILFTENETNVARLFRVPNRTPFVKDAFHTAIVDKDAALRDQLMSRREGTKAAILFERVVPAGKSIHFQLRLCKYPVKGNPFGKIFDEIMTARVIEADTFYAGLQPQTLTADEALIQRQALAGMLWSKQYYHLDIPRWLEGDPGQPAPPDSRKSGRNHQWRSLNNEDIISMPDKWEYPWYAAWDLAFHCIPLALVDPTFAKNQLILFLREWYMHPNGQIPAYEWAFGDVNPPVHAWACLQVFKLDRQKTGRGDYYFLKRVFQKLLLNFTWWVNRKDAQGKNVFEGGFLGLDNIGIFDRSAPLPGGGHLEQADGTAWMAMYCLNMLEMALLLCEEDKAYEDVATKFFEHFVYIAESLNRIGKDWTGAWDEEEGFFYDILALPGNRYHPLKVRSLVGLSTLFAAFRLPKEMLDRVPDFKRRLQWFIRYRSQLVDYQVIDTHARDKDLLLSLTAPARLTRLLQAMLDENEFLSPGGIRSVSKIHETPYMVNLDGQSFGLAYEPGESRSGLFGGNSNWRGPVWFPMNYLLIQSLQTYGDYFKDELKVECPTGSGHWMTLREVAGELTRRMIWIFRADQDGSRPVHRHERIYTEDPNFKDLVLFYEYFHGDNGRGAGASHQTGWTGLIADLIQQKAAAQERASVLSGIGRENKSNTKKRTGRKSSAASL